MDLLEMLHRSRINEFYKNVKYRKFLSFKPGCSNIVANYGMVHGSYKQI